MASITTAKLASRANRSEEFSAQSWQAALKTAIRDPGKLCQLLSLPAEIGTQAQIAAEQFGLFVPRDWLARIEKGNPADPLLRQILPVQSELTQQPGDQLDPVDDQSAAISPGVLQKYHSRVLLITTGICAVHCRYCFRRHFPYSDSPHSLAAWGEALAQIERDKTIGEVILSGGDPLSLVDDTLAGLIARIEQIAHVTRLRIHTRFGLMIPQRITDSLIKLLKKTRLQTIMVVHANHPREIVNIDGDTSVEDSLRKLVSAGIVTLNQSVLLRGVNDSAEVLSELSELLIQFGVMPYYLHQLDRVQGAAHFEVSISQGNEIIRQMREKLPGYAVPRYVQEVAGEKNKVVLA